MKAIQILQRSFKICLPALALAVPSVVVAFTAPDSSHPGLDQLIAALPAPSTDRIWVKLRQHLSLESLSSDLGLPDEQLAKLNDVSLDHEFRMGDWLVLPSQKTREIKWLAALNTPRALAVVGHQTSDGAITQSFCSQPPQKPFCVAAVANGLPVSLQPPDAWSLP